MIRIRQAEERGHADHGWLDAHHAFSFASYFDPAHMGFRSLRVLNEDRIAPGRGFGKHPHRDMEIVTVVLEGALEHGDHMGNRGVIRPGMVQRMTAGRGVIHSETNPSATDPVHLLQIWIEPAETALDPSYEEQTYDLDAASDRWVLLASPDGREESVTVHQDAELRLTRLDVAERRNHAFGPGRHGWLQVTRGSVRLGDHKLGAGDAAAISDEASIEIQGVGQAEVLLFDLA